MLTDKEKHKLGDYVLDELGSDFDLFDLKAHVDTSLNLEENMTILKEKLALFKDKQLVDQMYAHEQYMIKHEKMNNGHLNLSEVLKKHDIIGIAGNRDTAKSSLILTQLKALRKQYPKIPIYAMGIEQNLYNELKSLSIEVLESTMDILDLRIKNAIIYIDEFALLFSTKKQDKEQDKLMRFFDRISHQNVKLIISTAREGFYNKFMCSRITAFLVKQIEYDALVNGSWLKERVKAINSNSDYRLEAEKDKYYLVSPDTITTKYSFEYDKTLDSKQDNKNIFE